MLVQVFTSGPFSTNAYVVACSKTKQAAIIDPAPESGNKICAYLNEAGLKADKILLTHSHWDHIADAHVLKQVLHTSVYIHPLDAYNLEKPGSDGLPCWIPIPGCSPDVLLEEGQSISIGLIELIVIHTPGHTPGGVCFYNTKHGILFSGDTLFKGTMGNITFAMSRPDLMWSSLNKLAQLPSRTIVYPGHGSQTTIGTESSWLPYAQQIFG